MMVHKIHPFSVRKKMMAMGALPYLVIPDIQDYVRIKDLIHSLEQTEYSDRVFEELSEVVMILVQVF